MFLRACVLAVRLQPEAQLLIVADQRHAGIAVIDRLVVLMDQVHEGLQVGRGPPAFQIGVTKAQVALADQAREGVGVVDRATRPPDPGFVPFGAETAAIGDHEVEPPGLPKAARHLESSRKVARQAGLASAWSSSAVMSPPRVFFGRQCWQIRPAMLKSFLQNMPQGHGRGHRQAPPRPVPDSARAGSSAQDRGTASKKASASGGGRSLKLGDEATAVVALRVELFSLCLGVEDTEVGCRVGAGACGPLPAHRVRCGVPVGQAVCEPVQPDLPVGHQVLGQVRSPRSSGRGCAWCRSHTSRASRHRQRARRSCRAASVRHQNCLRARGSCPSPRASCARRCGGCGSIEVIGELAPGDFLEEGLGPWRLPSC